MGGRGLLNRPVHTLAQPPPTTWSTAANVISSEVISRFYETFNL